MPNISRNISFVYLQLKHSGDTESTPSAGTTECSVDVEAVACEHQPWKNVAAWMAAEREVPPMRELISADLHDRKIITKEEKLKGKVAVNG